MSPGHVWHETTEACTAINAGFHSFHVDSCSNQLQGYHFPIDPIAQRCSSVTSCQGFSFCMRLITLRLSPVAVLIFFGGEKPLATFPPSANAYADRTATPQRNMADHSFANRSWLVQVLQVLPFSFKVVLHSDPKLDNKNTGHEHGSLNVPIEHHPTIRFH